MNRWLGLGVMVAALGACGAASSAEVDIQHAMARVTIIPEARNDVEVSFAKANRRLHFTVSRVGDATVIDGGLGWHGANCGSVFGARRVTSWGVGSIDYDALPQIVVRTPMDVKVKAGVAVYGIIARARSVELDNAGCGDWSVANISGPATVRLAGSGGVRAANVGSAEVRISGSADVTLGDVDGGLTTATSGSGDIRARNVNGPLHVRLAGSGDVLAHGGQVTDMNVSIAGSGDVRFGGVAQSLQASVAGSGDVSVAHVTGEVSKHVAGSGEVTVGS